MANKSFFLLLSLMLSLLTLTPSASAFLFAAGPNATCPAPDYCSYYFEGLDNDTAPVFTIPPLADGDVQLSPPVHSRRNASFTIFVGNSGPELLTQPVTPYTLKNGMDPTIRGVFYLDAKPSVLMVRTHLYRQVVAQQKARYFSGRCIILPIQEVQITQAVTDFQVCNRNLVAPEPHHCPEPMPCVVFKLR